MGLFRRTPELLSQQRSALDHEPPARRDWRPLFADPRLLIGLAVGVWVLVFHGSVTAETRLVVLALLLPVVYVWHRFRRARGQFGGPSPDELRELGVPDDVVKDFQQDGFPPPGHVRRFTFSRIKHADGRTETHLSRTTDDGEFAEPPAPPSA